MKILITTRCYLHETEQCVVRNSDWGLKFL